MIDIPSKLEKAERLAETGYEVRSIEYISEAFHIFKQRPELFVSFAILQIAGQLAIRYLIPSSLAGIVISVFLAPLQMGYYIVARKIRRGEPCQFSNFFDAYTRLGPIIALHLLSILMLLLGFLLIILPGIYLAVSYILSSCFIWFLYDGQIFECLERSRKLITREWFSVLGFGILAGIVGCSGLLFLGIGFLVTLPAAYISIYVFFEDIIGTEEETDPGQPLESLLSPPTQQTY